MRKGLLDLEKHFSFYGAYHSNSVNVLIHIFFVWPIFFCSLILFDFTPPLLHFPILASIDLNFSFFFALFYAVFYISLDKNAVSLAALLCLLCWFGSKSLAARLGFSLAWKVSVATQLFCWIGQFIGHGVFEKRAPALLDNLSQAFIMAPFFVLLEAPSLRDKLDPHAIQCVFIGYSDTFKGFKCFEPISGKLMHVRHVLFNEEEFPYIIIMQNGRPARPNLEDQIYSGNVMDCSS